MILVISCKKLKLVIYTQTGKLICDWSDKKNCLIHCRMLKFLVRHMMVVEEFLEKISKKTK